MRRWLVPAALAMLGACVGRGPAVTPAPLAEDARQDAIHALSGSGRGPLLSEADIQTVARGLEAIRWREPFLRGVRGDDPGVELLLRDSAAARLPGSDRRRDMVVAITGIAPLDSLGRELQVREVAISWANGVTTLTPRFTRPIDAAAVRDLYERLPQVRMAQPILLGASSSGISARFSQGLIHYHFSAGWGDCTAGCVHRHAWHYTWDPRTGRVNKVSEEGDPVGR